MRSWTNLLLTNEERKSLVIIRRGCTKFFSSILELAHMDSHLHEEEEPSASAPSMKLTHSSSSPIALIEADKSNEPRQ